ncbi:glycosyltransferase family 4 protein [Actinomadura litoris]|uniref:Glycosyltransferase n=1 Tax=Actinomadura litoris TaxID=2678616 RepID=A0A7K1KVT0_9ACTN|nr:glycosyltransferase family 4 protein [Actinomadura litoris]MUN36157.1 glycosyltransferase [Actinomadura litoris]
MRAVIVVPGDVDAPSGGNVYDRRLRAGLGASAGELRVPGTWPRPDAASRQGLARDLAALPDGAVVLLDGLVACGVPEVVVPHADRLRLAVLVHLPLADETGLPPHVAADLDTRERAVLRAARAVVATSPWARRRLVDHHGLEPGRVHAVPPGTDPAPLAPGGDGASRLLCVASLTPRKGHDLLVEALAAVAHLPWTCALVGPLDHDPGHVARLRRDIGRHGLADRVHLEGPRTGAALDAAYAGADLAVLPSRAETYGMVVAEALARGVPVLATAAGAVPDTLGRDPEGGVPGLLVPPDDPGALAAALRRWLVEPALRSRLRASARLRRGALPGWDETSRAMAAVLDSLQEDAR